MKRVLTLMYLFAGFVGFSQEVYQLKKNSMLETDKSVDYRKFAHIFNDSLEVAIRETGDTIVSKGKYFEKIGELNDRVFVRLLPNEGDSNPTQKTFSISKSTAEEIFEETKGRWTFGLLTLPIKVRFEGGSTENKTKRYFNFEGGFNIGLSIAYRFNKNATPEIKTYGVFSVGTSQVKANAETTNDFISSEETYMAFSPTVGLVFEFKNDLQLIIITGIDYLSGKVSAEWLYRNKPFLGIGIGFSAFEFGKKPDSN